ncbi:MAG: CHAT domain-containing protein [Verrucomicrobia bacterium]|nr:CHAT domain-containing protein [Verrucomicrobiota bacterium]
MIAVWWASDKTGDKTGTLLNRCMFAGAPFVAASLWPVGDAATADLMVDFYEGLQANDKAVA